MSNQKKVSQKGDSQKGVSKKGVSKKAGTLHPDGMGAKPLDAPKKMKGPSSATSLDKRYSDGFVAISAFINELWEQFGDTKNPTPLGLYKRLLHHIKFTEIDSIMKSVKGFEKFLKPYTDIILSGKLDAIPSDSKIEYGDSGKVYIDIGKIIHKTDEETRRNIQQHLIAIDVILHPNKEKIDAFEKILQEPVSDQEFLKVDTSTNEGKFINNIMQRSKKSMENVDADNPMAAMFSIFQSGVVQEMVSGLSQGVESGQMDMKKLLGTMQDALGSIIPSKEPPKEGQPQPVLSLIAPPKTTDESKQD
jgi:hypothetical protein